MPFYLTTANYDTCYLGPCWERFTEAGGAITLKKLFAYRVSRERRFALTEQEARAAVRGHGGDA